MFNHLLTEVAGDRGAGTVYCLVEIEKRSGEYLRVHCKYTDEYVRTDGEWLFARRAVTSSFPSSPVVA